MTMPPDRLEEQAGPARPPLLAPSARLQEWLFSGALAVLAAGALSILASVVQLSEGLKPGFTLAHGFGWASLVPLLVVLRTYQALAGEADSPALRKSAQGLFGAVVLLQLVELAMLQVFPLWGEILTWVIVVLGMLALVSLPFASDAETPEPAPKATESDDDTAATRRARVAGGIGVGLFVLLKLAGKGLLAKFFALRLLGRLLRNLNGHWEMLGLGILMVLMAAFTVWFAVVKIRLRGKLGLLAGLLGVVEIVLLLGYGGFYIWSIAEFETAVGVPGANAKALEEELVRNLCATSMAVDLAWSSLTALLFWSIRTRYDPEREWFEELEPAPLEGSGG